MLSSHLSFTGRGSEEIAAKAIKEGVTEYLQKEVGTQQYTVLANRIRNSVKKYRAEKQAKQAFQALDTATKGIGIVGADGTYLYLNEAYASVYDRDNAELLGSHWRQLYPKQEIDRFESEILPELESNGMWSGNATGERQDGTPVYEQLSLSHIEDGAHVCVLREIDEHPTG